MQSQRIGPLALITLLTIILTPLSVILSVPFPTQKVQAQTPDALKARASQLFNQGVQQVQVNQFAAALETWQQALAIYRQVQDRQREGYLLENIGTVYLVLKNYPKAIDFYQQRLALARSLQDREAEKETLGNLGRAYRLLQDYAKAIDYYQQYLALARSFKDSSAEAEALGGLGLAYDARGNYGKAIEFYNQSLALAREIKDREKEEAALGNLGTVYLALEDYGKAIEYFEQTLAIAQATKNRSAESTSLDYLGRAYYFVADYQKAINYYQQSLVLARELQDHQAESKALRSLGNVYYYLDDYQQAINYYEQDLVIARSSQNRRQEGLALGNLALVYTNQGNSAKAIEYYQQDLAIAREFRDRLIEEQALGNLGLAYYVQKDYNKAIDYYEQALVIAREIKYRRGEGIILNNLGIALYDARKLSQAEKTLRSGIEILESLRLGLSDSEKVSIFEQQARAYRALQEVLIAQNKTDAALEIAERGRARAFVELLARRLSSKQIEPSSISPPTIAQIKQIAKAQNSTLVEYSIIDSPAKVKGKEYSKDSLIYIWVIKPTGEVTFRSSEVKPLQQKQGQAQGTASTIEQLVANTRGAIALRDRASLQQLHQLLIQPIADQLPADPNTHVIFIPQGPLFLAPFPALQDNGKYLIEKHTIVTAPSIQVLALTHQQRFEVQKVGVTNAVVVGIRRNAMVVGNPTMPVVSPEPGVPPRQLPSLPGAAEEAKAIAPLLHTQAITGNQATKVAIVQQLPKARIIHLATHGKADDVRGLGSWIALAPSAKDNGLLTAEEILDLKLNAELVVLSACDTGRGRITGDGVIGLSRSLISAGVPSVIVSLWATPDAPTASLMTEFYQNLQHSPDKAQALRGAMLTTMKENPNPRDWAAFTLIGESK